MKKNQIQKSYPEHINSIYLNAPKQFHQNCILFKRLYCRLSTVKNLPKHFESLYYQILRHAANNPLEIAFAIDDIQNA